MAGERSIVNIIADTGIGGSTVKDEWNKAVAKGLIARSERMIYTGLKKAATLRGKGGQVERISGEAFVDHAPEIPPEVNGKSKESETNPEIPERTGVKEEEPVSTDVNKEISTSLKSMELQLKNGLGTFESRLKNLEQAKSVEHKAPKTTPSSNTGTIDLRQGAQASTPETTEITEDPGDENEVDNDDENKEPPEGKSRVIFPDGQVAFIPTPYAEQMAKNQKGLRLLQNDVDTVAGVGGNPYEKQIVLSGTGTRRVVEINPKCEILFDYSSLTAFVNMAIDFFAWTQNTKREKGR